jgi:hypothetical protein
MKFVCVNLGSETAQQYYDFRLKLKSYGLFLTDLVVDDEELNTMIFAHGIARMIENIEKVYE